MNLTVNRTSACRRSLPAFSLVELLVVMAIISLLLVATVPMFQNSSNNARQTSREIIKAHLRQARAHAISTGTPTAIAIPTIASGKDLGRRSISMFEVQLENGVYKPRKDSQNQDVQLQRTAVLPGGFHFLSQNDVASAQATVVDLPETMQTSYRNQQHNCHIIVFAPNGQIVRPASGTPIHIAIAKAKQSQSGLTITERNAGKPVFDMLQVNRLTGKTRFVQQ